MVGKKYGLRIILYCAIVLIGLLCAFSLWHYHGSSALTQTQTQIEQRNNAFQNDRNAAQGNTDQRPRGQAPSSDSAQRMTPPSGSTPNGSMPNGQMPNRMSNSGTKLAPYMLGFSVVFFIFFIGAYYLFTHKKVKIQPRDASVLILTLLCIGFILRISLGTLMEGHNDINLFRRWATSAASNFSQFYAGRSTSDYPPLYIYVLYVIGKIASVPVLSPYYTLLLKLPSIMADIATSYLIYKLGRKYLSLEMSILVSAFYIFNPAVFINSTLWGQVDSFFTLILVSSVVMLAEKKIGISSALFTAAVLMKPQGIIFLPVLFFEWVRRKELKCILKAILSALITAVIIILPFSMNTGVLWIFKLFTGTVAEYPYASVNAFNFFGLLGANYTKDATTLFIFSYHTWGMIFIVLITAFSWFIFSRGKSSALASAAALLQIAGVFTFSTRMHERYLFPAIALSILALIYLKDKRLLFLTAGLSATVYINTHFVLFNMGSGLFDSVLFITSLMNVLLFGYLVKMIYDIAVRKKGVHLT